MLPVQPVDRRVQAGPAAIIQQVQRDFVLQLQIDADRMRPAHRRVLPQAAQDLYKALRPVARQEICMARPVGIDAAEYMHLEPLRVIAFMPHPFRRLLQHAENHGVRAFGRAEFRREHVAMPDLETMDRWRIDLFAAQRSPPPLADDAAEYLPHLFEPQQIHLGGRMDAVPVEAGLHALRDPRPVGQLQLVRNVGQRQHRTAARLLQIARHLREEAIGAEADAAIHPLPCPLVDRVLDLLADAQRGQSVSSFFHGRQTSSSTDSTSSTGTTLCTASTIL